MSLIKTLTYCLDILRIERDTGIYQTAMELAQKEVPIESVNNDNNVSSSNQEWITAMKIIADVYCSSLNNNNNNNNTTANSHILSQSQLCDFVTLSAKGIVERKMKTELVSNTILKIYRDIMENYETFNHSLISNYPSIIIDVISIINGGMNTKGQGKFN